MENKRQTIRRKADRERKQRILHIAKRLVGLETVFNQEIDALLGELDLTREELL